MNELLNRLTRQLPSKLENSSLLSSLMAIAIGLAAGFVFMLVSNSEQAADGFLTILTGGLEDMRRFGQVLYAATPILLTGLSFSFANKTGLFNIGAAGQFICGAYAAVLVGARCTFLPGHTLWITAILAAVLAGAIWGAIPGILKALYNVNEVISCIMTNYIGMYLVNYLISQTTYERLTNQNARVAANALIPRAGLGAIFRAGNNPSSVDAGILIAIVIAVLLYILLEKTSFGYELKACGLNRNAAKYAGINEKRSVIFSMMIAGAAAGVGGALMYLAPAGNRIDVVDVLAAEGFNGIAVALLAMNNPIGVIFSAIFVGYLRVGGFYMQRFNFAPQIIEIIVAIIIYFSAFALVFRSVVKSLFSRRNRKHSQLTSEPESANIITDIAKNITDNANSLAASSAAPNSEVKK